MVKLTDKGAAVYEIQSALRTMSRENSAICPMVVPDGLYGAETRIAVISFQKYMGIEETGIVNYITWQMIFGNEY